MKEASEYEEAENAGEQLSCQRQSENKRNSKIQIKQVMHQNKSENQHGCFEYPEESNMNVHYLSFQKQNQISNENVNDHRTALKHFMKESKVLRFRDKMTNVKNWCNNQHEYADQNNFQIDNPDNEEGRAQKLINEVNI